MRRDIADYATEFSIPTAPGRNPIKVSQTGLWDSPEWVITYTGGHRGWTLTRDRCWVACGDLTNENIELVSHADRDEAIALAEEFAGYALPTAPRRA